jgi:hypothetical protein
VSSPPAPPQTPLAAPSPAPAPAPGPAPGEACPLCGAPLHREQEWCLRCGAAARTRLAASPNWRAPLLAALAVAVLSLGVLAAALVKLAGGSGPSTPVSTTTVTSAAAPLTSSTAATVPGASTPSAAAPPPASTPTSTTLGAGATPSTSKPGAARTPSKAPTTSTGVSAPRSAGAGNGLTPGLEKRLAELRRQQSANGK